MNFPGHWSRQGGVIYVPKGYAGVFPYMIVDRVDELVEFLKQVFDANEIGRTVSNDRIANVQMQICAANFIKNLKILVSRGPKQSPLTADSKLSLGLNASAGSY